MKKMIFALALISSSAAVAQPATMPTGTTMSAQAMTSIPSNSVTVTNYYKQSVYDPSDSKIGEIADVLVNRDGGITAFIVDVGGFLGMGSKDVAVPFTAVGFTTKNNNKWYLVMNTTKDALKSAPGFTYDRTTTMWNMDAAK